MSHLKTYLQWRESTAKTIAEEYETTVAEVLRECVSLLSEMEWWDAYVIPSTRKGTGTLPTRTLRTLNLHQRTALRRAALDHPEITETLLASWSN